MANAISSVRATEAPVLDAPTVPTPEVQATGSIARDGLVLSGDARPEAPVDNSLLARGGRLVKTGVQAVGQVFSVVSDAIASAFVWNTVMQQYRAMERARERRQEAEAEANASHALNVALARDYQSKTENARKR